MPERKPRGESAEYVLEPDERQRLIASATQREDRVAVKLLMMLGLRVSEAIHLNYTWIRADGQLGVPRQQDCSCKACGWHGLWTPKTKAGARVVPIAATAWDDLKVFLPEYPVGLGPSVGGMELTRGAIYWRVKRLLEKAGVKKPGGAAWGTAFPHALRATAATQFAEIGFTAAELCGVMGWESLTIAEHYVNKAMAAKGALEKLRKAGL